jgi:hypothetical protein
MRCSWLSGAALAALSLGAHPAAAYDAEAFPRAVAGEGYLAIPVDTVERSMDGLSRRDAVEVTLENKDFFYAMKSNCHPLSLAPREHPS